MVTVSTRQTPCTQTLTWQATFHVELLNGCQEKLELRLEANSAEDAFCTLLTRTAEELRRRQLPFRDYALMGISVRPYAPLNDEPPSNAVLEASA